MSRLLINETIAYSSVGASSGDADPLDIPNTRIVLLRADLLWAITALNKSGYGTGLIKVLVENDAGTFVENTAYRKRFQRSFNSPGTPASTPCYLGGTAYQIYDSRGLFNDLTPIKASTGQQRQVRIILSLLESRNSTPADDATLWAGTVIVGFE